MHRFLLLFLLALGGGRVASAQSTGTIAGRILEALTEAPIPGVAVRVAGRQVDAVTDSLGRFVLRNVEPGIVTIEARRVGFLPVARGDLAVGPGKPVEVVLLMQRTVTTLSTIRVAPSLFPVVPPTQTAVSTSTFSAEEVRRTPGVQEDVVRAVSVLPGVGVTTGGRNDLVVRGGAPFENLFVVDNVEVPNVNHFGTQGSTGGPISILNIDFIDEASLSAGGFGARFGDRTSSVTSIRLREGARDRVASEVNLSVTGVGAIVEGPLGSRGTFLMGVRRSYFDLVFEAVGFAFVPAYSDLTAKAVFRPSRRDELSFLTIGADATISFNNDDADQRYDNARVLGTDQRQYFSGLTWKRLTSRGSITTTLGRTWTRFNSRQQDSLVPPNTLFALQSTEGENSIRSDATLQLTPTLELDAGVIGKVASTLDYEVDLPGALRRDAAGVGRPLRLDTSFTAARQGAYAQLAWQLRPRWRTSLGLRGDRYGFLDGAARLAPRASVTWQTGENSSLALSGGRYYQAPSFVWLVGDRDNRQLEPLQADQAVLSWQRSWRGDLRLQVEAFAKRYRAYPARTFRPQAVLQPSGFDDVQADIPLGLEPLRSVGTGRVTGGEVLLQKKLSEIPVYGLLSASYNRARFRGLDGVERPGAFDTPFIGNFLIGWRPSRSWELSTRLRSARGLPSTPFVTEGAMAGMLDFTRNNTGPRLPAFFTADLRVDRRWIFSRRQLIAYVDLQNVTGRENVSQFSWDQRTRSVLPNTSIGLLPSLGVNVEW